MSHSNISIFVPHLGCPHQCSFCNQKHITGQCFQPVKEDVDSAVNIAVSSVNYSAADCEIAFFGGSFTAIDSGYMLELLEAAYKYVKDGMVRGIRISTRPDCIDYEILTLLKKYGVCAIELGAQSMCNEVLALNDRGHRAEDVIAAAKLIKDFNFELGLQMMTGLYGSSDETDIFTAGELIKLHPQTVRIYPTIVLKNTALADVFYSGKYHVADIYSSVKLCVQLKKMFESVDIKVIRLGLHTIDIDAYVAGPWHPAFSELCDTEIYKEIIDEKKLDEGNYNVFVNSTELSKAIGQKKSNIKYFKEKNINLNIKPDPKMFKYQIKIEEVK